MGTLIGDAGRQDLARRVRLEMARQGLTREALAERAEVKERTLGNLLAGNAVRDVTVAKVARVLGIDLDAIVGGASRGAAPVAGGAEAPRASEAYGGYMLAAFEAYLGIYVAFRRVFTGETALYRSVFELDWDDAQSRLRFLELQRFKGAGDRQVASSHAGGVYISPHTGLLQLLTTYQGALRLITLSRFRLGGNRLTGLMLTQSDRDTFFQPAVSAIFLERLKGKAALADLERLVGPVGPGDPAFADAACELERIERTGVFMAAPR